MTSARHLIFWSDPLWHRSWRPGATSVRCCGGVDAGSTTRSACSRATAVEGAIALAPPRPDAWCGKLFRGLEFGGYLSEGRTSAVETDAANGLDGRSSAGYRSFERLYVEGRRTRVGGDVELTHGPWRLAADAVRVVDERNGQGLDLENLPAIVGTGASGSIAWRFGAAPASTPDASARAARTDGRGRSPFAMSFSGSMTRAPRPAATAWPRGPTCARAVTKGSRWDCLAYQ